MACTPNVGVKPADVPLNQLWESMNVSVDSVEGNHQMHQPAVHLDTPCLSANLSTKGCNPEVITFLGMNSLI